MVRDEQQEAALFNQLGSSLAVLEGAMAVDCYGSFRGHSEEQVDAMEAELDPPPKKLPNFTQLTGHEIVECSRCGSSGVMKDAHIVIRIEPASTHAMCAKCWVKRTSERLPYF